MKKRIKIAMIAMMGMSLRVSAQNEVDRYFQVNADNQNDYVASRIFLKSHSDYRGAGIFSLGQTNNWFIGNPYTDHANSFMIGVTNISDVEEVSAQKKYAKFYLNKDGNVGIGTTSPSEKLEVKEGNIRIYGVNTSRYIRFGEVNYQGAFINYDGTTNVLNIGVNNINTADTSNDYNAISIVRSGGNVGIGTTSPSEKLEVKDGNIRIEGLNTSRYIRFGEENYLGAFINYDGTANILNIGVNNVNAAEASNDYNAISIIRSSGKVGIGTTTTGSHKLAVEGSIGAREIKVEGSGWSDFVFENEYELPTLKEVENHIKEKGHLKDIPSAKEVEKNGFFLGAMDAKLLQKIEELTLYTIAQEKKLKSQKEEIENLKKQNSKIQELEKLVKKLIEEKK